MTACLRRIAFALGLQRESMPEPSDDRPEYFRDFGPNVPVEDLGGKPVSEAAARFYAAERSEGIERALQFIEECPAFTFEGSVRMGLPRGDSPVFYENNQPVYPGQEKAP